jgi:hypothetical protein
MMYNTEDTWCLSLLLSLLRIFSTGWQERRRPKMDDRVARYQNAMKEMRTHEYNRF